MNLSEIAWNHAKKETKKNPKDFMDFKNKSEAIPFYLDYEFPE
jgi:hypothetical protein